MSAPTVATGFTNAVALTYSANRNVDHVAYEDLSDRLLIADADGVWVARLATADRADATAFAHAPVDVRALCTTSAAGSPWPWCDQGRPRPDEHRRLRPPRHPA